MTSPSPKGADVADEYTKDPDAVAKLTDEQYQVTQQCGTEPAFNNEF
jgi:peptide methionine sulfoxide reductase MsrB